MSAFSKPHRYHQEMAYAIDVSDDSGDTGKASATTRHDANVLVGVLTELAHAVFAVVQISYSLAQR